MTESWYAAKIITSKSSVLKYIENAHLETFVPKINGKPLFSSLIFLHCPLSAINDLKTTFYQEFFIYLDPERKTPEAIPTPEMENFMMVINIQSDDFIPLTISDRSFLKGQKVRVLAGPLKGAEGIIKRIKGDRRLVVSISGVAAIATSFIRPELLEPVEEQ